MKFVRSRPTAEVVEIDPTLAKEMLSTSPGNRKIRDWYVDLLAAAMKRGEWRVTSQGIGFDVYGRLRDAHHRLLACVRSGIAFQSVVVFGLRPDVYEVTDVGIMRTYADRLDEDRNVAEVLRLGCALALSQVRPTVDQMRPIIDSGLGEAVKTLIECCGSKSKYFGSAPIRLAACVTIMDGGDAEFVLKQYRALCTLDFDSMSPSAKALVKQVQFGKAKAFNTREAVARGLRVFDIYRREASRIHATDEDVDRAIAYVRRVLREYASQNGEKIKTARNDGGGSRRLLEAH